MGQNADLKGDLGFLNLAEVLQLLGSNGSTGELRLLSRYVSRPAKIYFVEGNPVNASNGSLEGREALYSLFGWTEGAFEFTCGKVSVERLINRNLMELVLDGLRMLDDGEIDQVGAVDLEKTAAGDGKENELPLIVQPIVHYVSIVDEEVFDKDASVVEEGDYGNWIWVVLKGQADVCRKTSNGPLAIFRIGEGACVGNISSILMKKSQRITSVRAISEQLQLGVLDQMLLYEEFERLSLEMRRIVLGLDRRFREATDRIVEIFSRKGAPKISIKDRQPFMQQGAKESGVFQITEGKAVVLCKTKSGRLLLTTLGKGDVFGQLSFLHFGHEPDSAAVFGSENLKCRPVDGQKLRQEYERLSQPFRKIMEYAAGCVAVSTMKARRMYEEALTGRRK